MHVKFDVWNGPNALLYRVNGPSRRLIENCAFGLKPFRAHLATLKFCSDYNGRPRLIRFHAFVMQGENLTYKGLNTVSSINPTQLQNPFGHFSVLFWLTPDDVIQRKEFKLN